MNPFFLKSEQGSSFASVLAVLGIGSMGILGIQSQLKESKNLNDRVKLNHQSVQGFQANLSAIALLKGKIAGSGLIPATNQTIVVPTSHSKDASSNVLDQIFLGKNISIPNSEVSIKILDKQGSELFIETTHQLSNKRIRNRARLSMTALLSHEKLCETANSQVFDIAFPSIKTCPFNQQDNLRGATHQFQARLEQTESIPLPQNANFCSISFESLESMFKYDDAISLAINNRLIMGTHSIEQHLSEDSEQLPIWDWSQVSGKKWSKDRKLSFCHGDCTLARSDRNEKVSLTMTTAQGNAMRSLIEQAGKLDFMLITSGDNEVDDCQHTGLTLRTSVTFY